MSAERNTKTLLVVEDDAITRQGLAFLLGKEGYRVELAADGREGLDYLRTNRSPDLILLDMLMPVLDGWHFLEELKGVEGAAAIPIIVTTCGITTRDWAEDHGCAGFVKKPVDFDALRAEIRRCLR